MRISDWSSDVCSSDLNLLWSVGASWEISREPFYRLNSVPYLRLRSTYGFSGNIDPSMSALTTIRYVAVSPNTPGAPYARPDNYSNPDLRWETAGMFNIGQIGRASCRERVCQYV